MSARKRRVARSSVEGQRLAGRLRPSARELFPFLQQRLLRSRPVLSPARKEKRRVTTPDGRRSYTRTVEVPAVFGAPTFRNVIEDGVWR